MWILKYAVCMLRHHAYTGVLCRGMDGCRQYRYCLRCGAVHEA